MRLQIEWSKMMPDYYIALEKAIEAAQQDEYKQWELTNELCMRLKQSKHLCAFGMGKLFGDVYPYLSDRYHFSYLVDNMSEKWGKTCYGMICQSPSILESIKTDVIVIGMIGDDAVVSQQIQNAGIEYHHLNELVRNTYTPHHSGEWIRNQKMSIEKAYRLLEDELSQKVFVKAIVDRLAPGLIEDTFCSLQTKEEYYDLPFWELSEHEVYLDAGAYTGDSIEAFIETVDNKFDEIYGYELDEEVYKKLVQNVSGISNGHIHVFNIGINERSLSDGTMISIDDIQTTKPITLIKMDIEGYEQKAIVGASRVISEDSPKLAICLYHLLDDLWQIPLMIHQLNPDYKIYIRHHSPTVWDTVMYAVPE